jgi:hypothetical protein
MNVTVIDLLSIVGSLRLSSEFGFHDAATMASESEEDHINSRRLRRDLEGLGYLKAGYENVREVRVLSPRLCLLPEGSMENCQAILSGARTERLTGDQLSHVCTTANVKISRNDFRKDIPQRIVLTGSYLALTRVAEKLQIDIGDDPSVPDSWRLLHQAHTLRRRIEHMVDQEFQYQDIKDSDIGEEISVYSPHSGLFCTWQGIRTDYRSNLILFRKTNYDFRIAIRIEPTKWRLYLQSIAFDPLWVKWAIRLSSEKPEYRFDSPSNWLLSVPQLCPLPIELHQVACLCSGFLPSNERGQTVYNNVPPIIQQGIQEFLTLNDV